MANCSPNGLTYNQTPGASNDVSYVASVSSLNTSPAIYTSPADGSHVNFMVNPNTYLHNERQQSTYNSSVSSHSANGHHSMAMDSAQVPPCILNPHQLNYALEPEFWCSISYWELNTRIGDIFQASQPSIYVDGFTNPNSPERFCLGFLSNVNRDLQVERTRRSIGHGLRIYHIGPHVYVECMSDAFIYVQSVSHNRTFGFPDTKVEKVPKNANLKIFNNEEFYKELERRVALGFDAVYQLKELCTIRISFGKGWGPGFRLQAVTAAPCWIELHLKGPLQWLDRILTQMESPAYKCSSMS